MDLKKALSVLLVHHLITEKQRHLQYNLKVMDIEIILHALFLKTKHHLSLREHHPNLMSNKSKGKSFENKCMRLFDLFLRTFDFFLWLFCFSLWRLFKGVRVIFSSYLPLATCICQTMSQFLQGKLYLEFNNTKHSNDFQFNNKYKRYWC